MLTEKTARLLATQIVKQSNAIIKFGRTNGRICLHVRKPEGQSLTFYSASEWTYHPWNRTNQKKERE